MDAITAPAAVRPGLGQQKPAIGADFDTFLKMLTTQMQNQDPLNPIDSADYAVQLATFSGVEQQMRTNQLLSGLAGQFGVLGLSQLAGWVGQEARTAAAVWKGEAPLTVSYQPDPRADHAVLAARDAGGTVIAQEEVPLSSAPYQWLGGGQAGAVPAGLYQLGLESYAGDQLLSTSPVQAYARIIEARGGADGTRLVLQGGVEVAAMDVTALRAP